MQPSSGNRTRVAAAGELRHSANRNASTATSGPSGRPQWHWLPALVFAFGALPAYANGGGDQDQKHTFRESFSEPIENPCNRCQIVLQGTRTTTMRSTTKQNGSSEFRQETDTKGEGPEDCSLVNYKVDERHRLNMRSNQQVSRVVEHLRQRGDPQRPVLSTATNNLAVGWILESRSESHTNPAGNRTKNQPETLECRDRNGDGKEDF